MAHRTNALTEGWHAQYRSYTFRTRSHSLYRVSKRTYAFQPLWSGSHRIQRSNTTRAFATIPSISSMCTYLYQSWSTRGSSVTARSQTLRAWFTNRFAISISAYLSQMETERWW